MRQDIAEARRGVAYQARLYPIYYDREDVAFLLLKGIDHAGDSLADLYHRASMPIHYRHHQASQVIGYIDVEIELNRRDGTPVVRSRTKHDVAFCLDGLVLLYDYLEQFIPLVGSNQVSCSGEGTSVQRVIREFHCIAAFDKVDRGVRHYCIVDNGFKEAYPLCMVPKKFHHAENNNYLINPRFRTRNINTLSHLLCPPSSHRH